MTIAALVARPPTRLERRPVPVTAATATIHKRRRRHIAHRLNRLIQDDWTDGHEHAREHADARAESRADDRGRRNEHRRKQRKDEERGTRASASHQWRHRDRQTRRADGDNRASYGWRGHVPGRGECATGIRPRGVECQRLWHLKPGDMALRQLHGSPRPIARPGARSRYRIGPARDPASPANDSDHEGPDDQGNGDSAHLFAKAGPKTRIYLAVPKTVSLSREAGVLQPCR